MEQCDRSMVDITAEFLDDKQYNQASIEAYETVYGPDFVSPGGSRTARELIGRMALESRQRVLDVGCGLGGSAFLMAREIGVQVEGIDLSRNMIEMARQRLSRHGLEHLVRFEQGDCLELDVSEPFDAIYSREVFLHIHDKKRLFKVLLDALRPGGRLLFTDYCSGPPPWSDEFRAYVEQRGYCLHTVKEYQRFLEAAGLVDIHAQDFTAEFIDIHQREFQSMEEVPLENEQRKKLKEGWKSKIDRARRGEQRWGLFQARKDPG